MMVNRVRRAAPWFILGTFLLIASCCVSSITGFNRGGGFGLPPVIAPSGDGGVWTWGDPGQGSDSGSWNDRGDWGSGDSGSDSGSWDGGDWDWGGDDSGSWDWGGGDDSGSWDWGGGDDSGSWDWGGGDSGGWDSGGSDSGSW